jgi:hypothetical protein
MLACQGICQVYTEPTLEWLEWALTMALQPRPTASCTREKNMITAEKTKKECSLQGRVEFDPVIVS